MSGGCECCASPCAMYLEEGIGLVRPVHLRVAAAELRVRAQRARDDRALGHLGARRVAVEESLARRRPHNVVQSVTGLEGRGRPVGDHEGSALGDGHVERHHHGHELVANAVGREGRKPNRSVPGARRAMPRLEPLVERSTERRVADLQQPLATGAVRARVETTCPSAVATAAPVAAAASAHRPRLAVRAGALGRVQESKF
jgi:hypothetical protein